MSNTTTSCVFPLVTTKYPPYVTIGDTPCGLSCRQSQDFFIVYTRQEYNLLWTIISVVSLVTLCLTPLYLYAAITVRCRSQRSFLNLPFAYQCPFFISCGYLAVTAITMSPFLFGISSIICNDDEPTLTRDSFHNFSCSLTAIGVYVGIRLGVFYTCALSVSLVVTLYWPRFEQPKKYYHLLVWGCIALGIIPLIRMKSITGDYYLGICTTSLTSRFHLLALDIIPLMTCVFIFFVCLVVATIKLFRQNKHLFRLLSVNKDIRSLFHRLVLYNLLQTTAVTIAVFNFLYWYTKLDVWDNTGRLIVACEMRQTALNKTSTDDYEMCVLDNEGLPRPPLWTYYTFQLCALISVCGAILFQCSLKVQQRSMSSVRSVAYSIATVVRSARTRSRRGTGTLSTGYDYYLSPRFSELDGEEEADTTDVNFDGLLQLEGD